MIRRTRTRHLHNTLAVVSLIALAALSAVSVVGVVALLMGRADLHMPIGLTLVALLAVLAVLEVAWSVLDARIGGER